MDEENGYGEGVVATVAISVVAPLLVKVLGTWLLNSIAGTLLAYIAFAASILYFGVLGCRKIPPHFLGEQRLLGARTEKVYREGWVWNWPAPFGDICMVKNPEDPPERTQTGTNNTAPPPAGANTPAAPAPQPTPNPTTSNNPRAGQRTRRRSS